MNAEARWLHQGFFVLGDERDNFTRAVRDELKESLGLALKIRGYPSRQGLWQHTKWWHEGGPSYSEAQFCAQISKEYPVLSLGVSVEKGIEGGADSEDEMDRPSWDWPRFVRHAEAIFSVDVPRISTHLGQPVSLRINVWREGAETRAFSWLAGQWYERHKGSRCLPTWRVMFQTSTAARRLGLQPTWLKTSLLQRPISSHPGGPPTFSWRSTRSEGAFAGEVRANPQMEPTRRWRATARGSSATLGRIAKMSSLDGISLRTPRDLREKLEADFTRLSGAQPASATAQYAVFDFFVSAFHSRTGCTMRPANHFPLVVPTRTGNSSSTSQWCQALLC